MRIVYHIGLHCTDEDRALACLRLNESRLEAAGTLVPAAQRYRPLLRKALGELRGAPADTALQAHLLDAMGGGGDFSRLVLSNDSFLCVPARAVQGETLYPQAAERAQWLRALFSDAPAEFHFAIRNPATFLPALQARFAAEEDFAGFLARIEPEALSWADMVARFRAAVPECRVTVWCDEDTPLIWPEVLGALSADPDPETLAGVEDFPAALLAPEGLARMRQYLAEHPPRNAEHRRRVMAAFLDRFARPEAVEVQFDQPGWTTERIARLTQRYEADIARIAAMPGLRFLAP